MHLDLSERYAKMCLFKCLGEVNIRHKQTLREEVLVATTVTICRPCVLMSVLVRNKSLVLQRKKYDRHVLESVRTAR